MRKPNYSPEDKSFFFFFPLLLLKKPPVSKALQLYVSAVLLNVWKNKVSQWN